MLTAILTIGAAAGVFSSGSASAASYYPLCVQNGNGAPLHCAFAQGSGYVVAMYQFYSGETNMTNWVYNSSGELQQANTNLCMQINHNAGNIVQEATCKAASYQTWTDFANGANEFVSNWSDDGNWMCLTYNADNADLDVIDCSTNTLPWYEAFWEAD